MTQTGGNEGSSPYSVTSRRERRRILRAVRESLNDRQRLILELYYDRGLTFQQIALHLGVTKVAVAAMHRERILPTLRKAFEERGITLRDLL